MNVEGPDRALLQDKQSLDAGSLHARLLSIGGMPHSEIFAFCASASALAADPVDLALGEGKIDEVRLLTGLAAAIGGEFREVPPPPASDTRAEEAFALRSYLLGSEAGGLTRVISPNGAIATLLLRRFDGGAGRGIILTTRQAMLDALAHADRDRIAEKAISTLPMLLSARPQQIDGAERVPNLRERIAGPGFTALVLILLVIVTALVAPGWAVIVLPLLLAPIFTIAAISVLTAATETLFRAPAVPETPAPHLPRYTLLVPLYKETEVVAELVSRLDALNYPRDRIETFLLLEEDDEETANVLDTLALPAWFLVLTVPSGSPRTKPRALNAALPFACGDLLVVYDAEDHPEADQLLKAAALFAGSSSRLACAQGRLAISNVGDGWLTRRFAIEYAALFDCVKSGSARLDWPVPLGGSSNHFRSAILRRVGGWDAWNVTEDADLGVRLARFGYRVADLASTTWEEAPNTLRSWMNQRSRWMKGWMQSLMVHARTPLANARQLGAFRAMVLATTAGSVILGALLYPVFAAALVYRFSTGIPLGGMGGLIDLADAMIILSLTIVTLVEIVPALIALRRRRALALVPYILLAPLSYALVSIAAWRALAELVLRPYHWHKTSHGRAKTSGGLARLDS